MHHSLDRRALPVLLLSLLLPSLVPAQQLPPHPRLLFTPQEKAVIQQRIQASGTEAARAYGNMAWSVSLRNAGSLPSLNGQWSYLTYWSLRDLMDVAFRYQMTGSASFGNDARDMLLECARELTPTDDKPYRGGTYVMALSMAYDMVHAHLTPAERAVIVQHLERWIVEFKNGRNEVGRFTDYTEAVDNFTFSWAAGIVMALLATAEDSSFPDPIGDAVHYMGMIKRGWNDAVNPDGTIEESYGYATYGVCKALYAGWAMERVGLGDWISGTNIVRAPYWLGASLVGSHWFYFGDAHDQHKGTWLDPIVWAAVGRDPGAGGARPVEETRWALDRVFALSPPGGQTSSGALSPHLAVALFYPDHVTPRAPRVLSGFYRDNLNENDPWSNKLRAYPGVGEGGLAILHAETRGDARTLSAFYMIKDEWQNHGHEDDGHFGLAVRGEPLWFDMGYTRSDFYGAQAEAHSIVLTDGVSAFEGSRTNHYRPPPTNGRFLGKKKDAFISRGVDFVRGDHRHMWQMNEATRSVFMVKGADHPYVILVDRVERDGNVRVYRERFHAVAPTTGSGTVQDPLRVSRNGRTAHAVWVAPANVVISRRSVNTSARLPGYPVDAVASGRRVSYVSIHSEFRVSSTSALIAPSAGTDGSRFQVGSYEDKVLLDRDGSGVMDAETASDAHMVWMRTTSTGVQDFFASRAHYLSHGGGRLFAASRAVSVCVKDGIVEVGTDGQGVQDLVFVVSMPGLSEVWVDGTRVPATITAQGVSFGAAAPPIASTDDRGYAFDEGFLWDARLSAQGFVNAGGRLAASGSVATLRLADDREFANRPVAFGFEVIPALRGLGTVAALHLGSSPGAGDVLRMDVRVDGAGALSLEMYGGGQTPVSWPLLLRSASGATRVEVEIDPVAGEVVLRDPVGAEIGRVTLNGALPGFHAKVLVHPGTQVDDVTVFDSLEDGVTAQGLAFYKLPSGKAGFYARMPGLIGLSAVEALFNGIALDESITTAWWVGSQMTEEQITQFLAPSGGAVGELRTMGWMSRRPALLGLPGTTAGLCIVRADGLRLYGEIGF